jgi:hypothetical protein
MFEELFKRPNAIRRHLAGPLLDERLQFLCVLTVSVHRSIFLTQTAGAA